MSISMISFLVCSSDGFTNILTLQIYEIECCYLHSKYITLRLRATGYFEYILKMFFFLSLGHPTFICIPKECNLCNIDCTKLLDTDLRDDIGSVHHMSTTNLEM